jgi:ABC-2 type transport system ATP-binding protein
MISCDHLTKRYGELTAVDGVSFELGRGEVCALLGPNGAGKSTLVKMLCGLIAPDAGSATVAGYPIAAETRELRRHIGVVPDTLALFSELTIEEHLAMSGPIYGLDRRTTTSRCEQLLRVLGIYDTRHTFAKDCSHGMRKKTALAMALLHSPSVLFLDEPFEGIDPVSAETIRRQLRWMSARGITVLLTSHILSLVEGVADRLMLLRAGRLAWNSPISEIRAKIEDLYFELAEAPATEELTWLHGADFSAQR